MSGCASSLSTLFQTGGCPRYGGADTGRSVYEGLAVSRDEGGLHIIGCALESVVFDGVNFGSLRDASAWRWSSSTVDAVHAGRPVFTKQ